MNAQTEKEKYLRTEDIAERLDCDPGTVRKLVAVGQLEAIRVGRVLRYPPSAVEDYRSRQRVAA